MLYTQNLRYNTQATFTYMHYLRSPDAQKKYKEHQALHKDDPCPLCQGEAIKTFQYWKIMSNLFPYDRIAETHHMILPIRHVTEEYLSEEELDEFLRIKHEYIFEEYEVIIEASGPEKSIPEHHHLHLIITKAP